MSFKRAGDDGAWLKSVTKRRVSELLSEAIPEDEAILMKNGRLACMVCSNRPVFDTVNMLAIHRQGKKHLESIEWKKQEAEEVRNLKRKRQHDQYLRTGALPELVPEDDSGNKKTFLGCAPYNSCAKKRPNQRRSMVDLGESSGQAKQSCGKAFDPDNDTTIADYQKRVRAAGVVTKPDVRPYQRRGATTQTHRDTANQPVRTSAIGTSSSHLLVSSSSSSPSHLPVSSSSSSSNLLVSSSSKISSSRGPTKTGEDTLLPSVTTSTDPRDNSKSVPGESDGCLGATAGLGSSDVTQQKVETAKKYLNAIASGWKKDRQGTWVKDEVAEFDSDDEPPDIP